MLFEEFDKKVREAAEHHHPAYDENAWAKMEKLLDREMPVKENRRRRFFLLFFLLLALGIGGTMIINPWKRSGNDPVVDKTNSTNSVSTKTPTSIPQKENKIIPLKEEAAPTLESTVTIADQPLLRNSSNQPVSNKNYLSSTRAQSTVFNQTKNQDEHLITKSKPNELNELTNSNKADFKDQTATKTPEVNSKLNDPKELNEQPELPNSNKTDFREQTPTKIKEVNSTISEPNELNELQELANSKKRKSPIKKIHSFFVSLGGGPDLTFISASDPGKTKLFGGAGIGYMYNNRLSLRTGFYTGRKIYSADPDDYYQPPGFALYYPNLQKVDADCRIYEIPVSVGYHFGNKEKRQFFVAATVSSYYMKEETYNYHYKYSLSGPTYSKERSSYDGDFHAFAGLGVSAGYTHKINKRISFSVEPYAKFPVKGIGYGKVKLNSAGVLVSAEFQPFWKTKK